MGVAVALYVSPPPTRKSPKEKVGAPVSEAVPRRSVEVCDMVTFGVPEGIATLMVEHWEEERETRVLAEEQREERSEGEGGDENIDEEVGSKGEEEIVPVEVCAPGLGD